MRESSVVDVFCGIGGLSHGFVLENVHVVAGIDSDLSCRFSYESNNNAMFIGRKIEDISPEDILGLYPEGHVRILVGCAPCQPFSKYSQGKPSGSDQKWRLVSAFADLIEAVKPDIVSMENVPDLISFKGGSIYGDFVRRLDNMYPGCVTQYKVETAEYGVPQTRKRLVLFASRFGKVELLKPTHMLGKYRTVRDAIGNMPPIVAGQTHPDDPLHRSSSLSDVNMRRIRASVPGGSWRDWPDELRSTCHRKHSGKTYISVYGRMKWDEPSPTITTEFHGYGNGRFGHPEQDRALSLREAALLQTFPQGYMFVGPGEEVTIDSVARHIGNAVPVEIGRVIARSICRHLEDVDE